MKTLLINGFSNITKEGVTIHFNQKFTLNGNLATDKWWVSWDMIGKALCGDKYCDETDVTKLKELRKEVKGRPLDNTKYYLMTTIEEKLRENWFEGNYENCVKLCKEYAEEQKPKWIKYSTFVEKMGYVGYCWVVYKGDVCLAYMDKDDFMYYSKENRTRCYMRECIEYIMLIEKPKLATEEGQNTLKDGNWDNYLQFNEFATKEHVIGFIKQNFECKPLPNIQIATEEGTKC